MNIISQFNQFLEKNFNFYLKNHFNDFNYYNKSSSFSNYFNFINDLDSFSDSFIKDIIKGYFEYIDNCFFNSCNKFQYLMTFRKKFGTIMIDRKENSTK